MDEIGKSGHGENTPASCHERVVAIVIHDCVFSLVKAVDPLPQCLALALLHLNKQCALFFVGSFTPAKLVKNGLLRSLQEETD